MTACIAYLPSHAEPQGGMHQPASRLTCRWVPKPRPRARPHPTHPLLNKSPPAVTVSRAPTPRTSTWTRSPSRRSQCPGQVRPRAAPYQLMYCCTMLGRWIPPAQSLLKSRLPYLLWANAINCDSSRCWLRWRLCFLMPSASDLHDPDLSEDASRLCNLYAFGAKSKIQTRCTHILAGAHCIQ